MNKKNIKFTIITPTIGRTTLYKTIESIQNQTYTNFQHIILADGQRELGNAGFTRTLYIQNDIKLRIYDKGEIELIFTHNTNNFGNTQRHIAWYLAQGDYILYLDDDDYYSDPTALEQIANALEKDDYPELLVFPALRQGQVFFNLPPGFCRTVSCQYAHKVKDKEGNPIQWPNTYEGNQDYGIDSNFVQSLNDKYGFVALATNPLVTVDFISKGELI